MRRVILLVVLALVLLGTWALSRASAEWHYVVPSEAGKLLYAAAFDGFTDEWAQSEGRNSHLIADGVMRVEVGETQNVVWSPASPRFTDFDMTVDATATAGPDNNGFGVVFRLSDDLQSFYLFLISSDGYYSLERRTSGNIKLISNWVKSPVINLGMGAKNQIRVVARGDQFEFFVNGQRAALCIPDDPEAESTYRGGQCIGGQMLDTLTDASLPVGRIGVAASTLDEPDVVVEFDNLIVYGPSEEN